MLLAIPPQVDGRDGLPAVLEELAARWVAVAVAWYRFAGDVDVALLVVGGSGGLRYA